MISICYDGEKKSDAETSTRAVFDYVREEKIISSAPLQTAMAREWC